MLARGQIVSRGDQAWPAGRSDFASAVGAAAVSRCVHGRSAAGARGLRARAGWHVACCPGWTSDPRGTVMSGGCSSDGPPSDRGR